MYFGENKWLQERHLAGESSFIPSIY